MKEIRTFLEKSLNEAVEDARYYDSIGDVRGANHYEGQIWSLKKQLEILAKIEECREGNLLRFRPNGKFRMWCIRETDGGERIVEHYNTDLELKEYKNLIEISDCLDVTSEFDIELIVQNIVITDDIAEIGRRTDKLYLVSDDTLFEAVSNIVHKPEHVYLDSILIKHFGCKNPFLKKPRIKERFGGRGNNSYEYLTIAGGKAYGELVDLVYDLGGLLPDLVNANEIVDCLDSIVDSHGY